MKTTLLASVALASALALAALVPGGARAETVGKERFGCHARELTDKLFQLVAVDEAEAFGRLLRASLADGTCRMWKPGEEVRVENRTTTYGCLAAADAAGPCYWTPLSAVDKPD